MSNLGDFLRGLVTLANQYGGLDTVRQATDIEAIYDKAAADAMASTATADTLVWTNPYDFDVYVVSGKYVGLGAGLTADANNNATITFKTNDGAGGATAAALAVTTSVADGGTWISNRSKAFTARTLANCRIPAGGGLWINITKGGTGVVVPISRYHIRLQRGE